MHLQLEKDIEFLRESAAADLITFNFFTPEKLEKLKKYMIDLAQESKKLSTQKDVFPLSA